MCMVPRAHLQVCESGAYDVSVPLLDKKGKPVGEVNVSMTFKVTASSVRAQEHVHLTFSHLQ